MYYASAVFFKHCSALFLSKRTCVQGNAGVIIHCLHVGQCNYVCSFELAEYVVCNSCLLYIHRNGYDDA